MSNNFPQVNDGNLTIVTFSKEHLTPKYVAWLNDKEVVRFSEQRHKTHTLETCETYFHEVYISDDYFLAIELAINGVRHHVGNLGVTVDKVNNSADLSIIIGEKSYWGSGIGTRAWRLLAQTLLERMSFRLLTAGAMSINTPMLKLFLRSNMKIDAILPERFLWDGEPIDLIVASASDMS
jgi:RimJ/RimL family protein N-acetyltransferase